VPRNIRGLKRGGPGRPLGSLNKATRDMKAFSREVLEDPDYIKSLKARLLDGKAPHMETLLAHYAYGKPADTLRVTDETPPLMVIDTLTAEDVERLTRERDDGR